ncbi:MAG: hypothetical protein KU37_05185 [Sulfuricurvum sp. PC08-66]|nr:MAG: hypothetical protein KU37_05185 [Sulfuricurvum sp. PC08-66]
MYKTLRIALLFLLFGTWAVAAIQAIGYGASESSAKKAALSELSNMVSSNVKSNLSSTTTLKGDKVTKDAQIALNVASHSYFQGVTYSDPVMEGSEYKVTAFLDEVGVANTLAYLRKELYKELEKLTRNDLEELLNKAQMAYALANFSLQKESIQSDVKAREAQIQEYLTFAKVTFNVTPATATIVVNDTVYEPYKTHLFAPKEYTFTMSAEGYYSEEGRISFGRGETRTVVKELVKVSAERPKVFVQIEGNSAQFTNSVASLLLKYGVDIASSAVATNALIFAIDKQYKTEVNGMAVYDVTVTMRAYKERSQTMVKQVKRANIVDANYNEKVDAAIKALTQYMLQKSDMKSFIGNERVNYNAQ